MNRQQRRAAARRTQSAAEDARRATDAEMAERGAAELLAAGVAHHQAGRLAEAEVRYRQILADAPDHADALHLLGVIAFQVGRHEMAVQLIDQAIGHNAGSSLYYSNRGLALQGLARLDEAVASYDRAVALAPDNTEAWNNRGLALHGLGQFEEALESYERALAFRPDYVDALNNRGNTQRALARLAEAVQSYDRALALRPDLAEAHYNRGDALRDLGRLDEAVDSYDRALGLKPDYTHALNNRGLALHQLKRFEEAVQSFDLALAHQPDHAAILVNRGHALHQLKRFGDELESYDRALAGHPDYVEALANRGLTLHRLGRFDEALESFDRSLVIEPGNAEVLNNRGLTLHRLGRSGEALESHDRAVALRPDYAEALSNRGLALRDLERFDEALKSYDQALAVRPDFAEALINRGVTLHLMGRLAGALESYDRALAVRPDEAVTRLRRAAALEPGYAAGEWFHARQGICDWSGYHDAEARVQDAVEADASSCSPFVLLTLSSTPEQQLECARRAAAEIAVPQPEIFPSLPPRPGEKIRLGYLSATFHVHPGAFLVAGLIEHHDRRRFEVNGYSYGPDDGSAMRARLIGSFDRFVDIRDVAHRRAAELMRADGLDIIIDLTGYTDANRTEILAYRPAPIQVNYLGYPGTMGADFIDYLIIDQFVVPPDQQPFFSEQLVYLPDCYQCNDDKREISERTPLRSECGLPEQGLVFCCFNSSYKITPDFFDIWMRLLRAAPQSALWLYETHPLMKANLKREAGARGVAPERLVFAPTRALPEHLARHRLADLFLDTLPVNAHTTASDALWAGLPILTCAGDTFAGRVAGSLLLAIGLGELVTASLEEYEAAALRLATEPSLLAELRQRLATNRLTMPLFDTARFARNIEAVYTRMWETWNAGRKPTAFSLVTTPGTSGTVL